MSLEQSTCSGTAYLFIVALVECRAGAWISCVFGTESVLGTRVWRGARFWSRVARAREEFEFGSRNARVCSGVGLRSTILFVILSVTPEISLSRSCCFWFSFLRDTRGFTATVEL